MKANKLLSFLPEDPRERLAIAAGCAALLFVFGGDMWNATARLRDVVRDGARENMPLDAEIDRARQLVAALIPDLRTNHEVIVREQVEIEELRSDIEKSREQLKQQRDQLLSLRAKLGTRFITATNSDTEGAANYIRQDLRHRFATFQSAEATVDAKAQTLQYREESLAKAQSAQHDMLRKKRELEAQVAQFEAQLKLIGRNRVDSRIVVDRDKLSRCEELLRYLRKRLTIAERVSGFDEQDAPEPRPSEKEIGDERIEAEIDHHFEREKVQKRSDPS